ncbi:hypothetical protein [Streptomyces sp. NPDC048385]|uniref:hypothetical protein n=1 Tax=unclassified Streptomyces TaxID=2593676 RepID=UPI00342EA842
MASLVEELEAREAAARLRVEDLQARIAELAGRLEVEREAWSRLRVTRETVAEVLAEISGAGAPVGPPQEAMAAEESSEPVRMVGAIMVPHWREGLSVDVLPDVYRDIVEIVADATKPMQAKQIVPRIGLPAVTAKIEGTRGKLKRLVERGWLSEERPGLFALAHPAGAEAG